MNKNFLYLFTAICIVCCSCTPSFKWGRYAGKYNIKKKSENPNDFTFLEDSTFSYDYYGSVHRKCSTGKYEVKDNKIILNSNIKEVFMPEKYSILPTDSLKDKNRITVRFEVPEVRSQENYKCVVVLNKDTLNNDNDPMLMLKRYLMQGILKDIDKWGTYTTYYTEPLDSVNIEIWISNFVTGGRVKARVITRTIYFDGILGKDIVFDIKIDESLFGYRVFDNIILDIKRNKIVFIDTEEDNRKNILFYKKNSSYSAVARLHRIIPSCM